MSQSEGNYEAYEMIFQEEFHFSVAMAGNEKPRDLEVWEVRGGREDAGGQFVCECIVLYPYEARDEWTCPSVLTSCFCFCVVLFWERAKENYWTISDFYKSLFSSPHQVVE